MYEEAVLACDPSISAFGYTVFVKVGGSWEVAAADCIITDSRPLPTKRKVRVTKKHGKVVTPAKAPPPANEWDSHRLRIIAKTLVEVVQQYNIKEVRWEDPIGSKSYHANKALSQVKGMMVMLCEALGLVSKSMTAVQVKDRLLGKRDAEKHEVAKVALGAFPHLANIIQAEGLGKELTREAITDSVGVFLALDDQPIELT